MHKLPRKPLQIAFILISSLASTWSFAHTRLIQTLPAANSTVKKPLSSIELHFADPIILMSISLSDSANKALPVKFKPDGQLKKQHRIAVSIPHSGTYKVRWMTLGQDGHKMDGEYLFKVQIAQ